MTKLPNRIYLSSPHMGGREFEYLQEAYKSNWIAPLGPFVDRFERDFCSYTKIPFATAMSSGTAALHVALRLCGVEAGDEVFCSSFTFVGSVGPIIQMGAIPVFVDSNISTWNMDPNLLAEALENRLKRGKRPKALILVHLYGQCSDIDPIKSLCQKYEVPLIEDAAEALGATYRGAHTGSFGQIAIFSFNGNKIISTGGGGMLVAHDSKITDKAKFYVTQAREPALHYEHKEVGYNYRLSNLLAAVGVGQLSYLDERINSRRRNFDFYKEYFRDYPGIEFMPEADYGRSTRWLSCAVIKDGHYNLTPADLCNALLEDNIEARPLWKPMHLQPIFAGAPFFGSSVSETLFRTGVCLPSGSNLSHSDLEFVADRMSSILKKSAK